MRNSLPVSLTLAKLILLRAWMLLGCCLLPTVLTAQVGEHRSEFSFGINGGYVLSSVGFTPRVPQKQHGGMTAGVTFRYTSEKYFSSICAVVGEVNYVQAGWRQDILTIDDQPVINASTGQAETYERQLNYLQLPIFARMGWGRERSGMQFFFQIGPQVGWLLGSGVTKNYSFDERNLTDRTSKVVEQETMDIEHKFDYGIAGGLGLEYSNRHIGHFLIEGRYYFGLGNLYGNSKRDYFAKSNLSTITVKVSYLFDLAKTINPKIK